MSSLIQEAALWRGHHCDCQWERFTVMVWGIPAPYERFGPAQHPRRRALPAP